MTSLFAFLCMFIFYRDSGYMSFNNGKQSHAFCCVLIQVNTVLFPKPQLVSGYKVSALVLGIVKHYCKNT